MLLSAMLLELEDRIIKQPIHLEGVICNITGEQTRYAWAWAYGTFRASPDDLALCAAAGEEGGGSGDTRPLPSFPLQIRGRGQRVRPRTAASEGGGGGSGGGGGRRAGGSGAQWRRRRAPPLLPPRANTVEGRLGGGGSGGARPLPLPFFLLQIRGRGRWIRPRVAASEGGGGGREARREGEDRRSGGIHDSFAPATGASGGSVAGDREGDGGGPRLGGGGLGSGPRSLVTAPVAQQEEGKGTGRVRAPGRPRQRSSYMEYCPPAKK
ncbi:hypothetical protein [Oryza sativa Japonica Group]|uniref:Uncharacterized protein n=1 Tax=Oryza sativa subsp. japonica TaxID=39947 RepID=Q5QMW6_ORYSJ|nr:hypothetical protein [Oryza sativa Japonica Group]